MDDLGNRVNPPGNRASRKCDILGDNLGEVAGGYLCDKTRLGPRPLEGQ